MPFTPSAKQTVSFDSTANRHLSVHPFELLTDDEPLDSLICRAASSLPDFEMRKNTVRADISIILQQYSENGNAKNLAHAVKHYLDQSRTVRQDNLVGSRSAIQEKEMPQHGTVREDSETSKGENEKLRNKLCVVDLESTELVHDLPFRLDTRFSIDPRVHLPKSFMICVNSLFTLDQLEARCMLDYLCSKFGPAAVFRTGIRAAIMGYAFLYIMA